MRIFFFAVIATMLTSLHAYNVGLCVMATGRYDTYAQKMIDSARTYFCQGHNVTFFVFTDGCITKSEDVTKVHQDRLGWPYDTLQRFHVYYQNKDLFQNMDYLFAIDADMLFVAPVGDEILGDRVATQHPGFVGKRGTYETNSLSRACIRTDEGQQYFAGGFYGGSREEFIHLLHVTKEQIDADLALGFIAIWHDESHLNRFFIDHPPTRILNPSYCYPEDWPLPYPQKLLALNKNHAELRR